MAARHVWLIRDDGVVVGEVAYFHRADAEHDAEVLRDEALEALGYPVSPGQIDVYCVSVVAERLHVADRGTPLLRQPATSGPGSEVDPFAPPAGFRPPKPGTTTVGLDEAYSSSDLDPFALPTGHSTAADRRTPSAPGRHGSGSQPGTDPGGQGRRHLTVVR